MPFTLPSPWPVLPRRPPAPGAALRTLGVGLALLAYGCDLAAQAATQRPAGRDSAPLPSRGDESAATTPYEVTAVRSHMLGRPAPLPRLDGRASNDLVGVTYRVWRSSGRADVGVGVGTLGYLVPSADGRADGPQALVGAVPALSMGVRYRVSDEHAVFADASRARGLGAGPADVYYGTKVGVEWRPAKPTLGLERGALGFQLESGYKLSLRVRRGGPSLYLRGQF